MSLWVWHNYRTLFQRAVTAKSYTGVDNESKIFHECNFIVETAVECCLLNIAREILTMGGVPFHHSTCIFNSAAIASIASQALNEGVSVNPEMVRIQNKHFSLFLSKLVSLPLNHFSLSAM